MDLMRLKANVTYARDWIEQGREAFAWGMLVIILNDLGKLEQELANTAVGSPPLSRLNCHPAQTSGHHRHQRRPTISQFCLGMLSDRTNISLSRAILESGDDDVTRVKTHPKVQLFGLTGWTPWQA